jgi:hypothetical protein
VVGGGGGHRLLGKIDGPVEVGEITTALIADAKGESKVGKAPRSIAVVRGRRSDCLLKRGNSPLEDRWIASFEVPDRFC